MKRAVFVKVLLVSCGDVGIETGLRFQARGAHVTAWRRNPDRLPATFQSHGVDVASGQFPPIAADTDVVLFTPVPASRDVPGYEHGYLHTARRLIEALKAQAPSLSRFFYVSSTAVNAGQDGQWVDERAPKAPTRPTATVLAQTEDLLLSSGLPVTILRAAGIYGPGRTHLINLVRTGEAKVPAGSHWTNRIHRDDLAKAVVHLAELGREVKELYLATDNHPTQLADIYRHLASLLGVAVDSPDSQGGSPATDRRLSNALLRSTGWEPTFPDYREGYRAVLRGSAKRHG